MHSSRILHRTEGLSLAMKKKSDNDGAKAREYATLQDASTHIHASKAHLLPALNINVNNAGEGDASPATMLCTTGTSLPSITAEASLVIFWGEKKWAENVRVRKKCCHFPPVLQKLAGTSNFSPPYSFLPGATDTRPRMQERGPRLSC